MFDYRVRTSGYHEWCNRTGRRNIICPEGFSRIGDMRFGSDGMLYIGRKRRPSGHYMVNMNIHGVKMVLRHADQQNINRVEQLRWKLLEHIETTLAPRIAELAERLAVMAHSERLIGCNGDQFFELKMAELPVYYHRTKPVLGFKLIELDDMEPLDKIAQLTIDPKVISLVSTFSRLSRSRLAYEDRARRVSYVLDAMMIRLSTNHDRRKVFNINGRTYSITPNNSDGFTNGYTIDRPTPESVVVELPAGPVGARYDAWASPG